MPDDVPLLRSVCHLLPLDLPSQFITYPPNGMRLGVQDTAETPCVRANRRKLRQILLTNLDVHWGKQGVRVEEDADVKKVTVHFQDGTSATGDLLVGADGTWSKSGRFSLLSVLPRASADQQSASSSLARATPRPSSPCPWP